MQEYEVTIRVGTEPNGVSQKLITRKIKAKSHEDARDRIASLKLGVILSTERVEK